MNFKQMTLQQIEAEFNRLVSANEQAAQTIQRLAAELEAYREAFGQIPEEPPVFEDDFFAFDAPIEECEMEELSESEKNWYYHRQSEIEELSYYED